MGRSHVRSTLSEETPVPTVDLTALPPGAAGELLTLQRAAEQVRPGPELAHLVEGSR